LLSRACLALATAVQLLLSFGSSFAGRTLNATCANLGETCGWSDKDLGNCHEFGRDQITGKPVNYFCFNPNAPWFDEAMEESAILRSFYDSVEPVLAGSPPIWYNHWDPSVAHCLWPRIQCREGRVIAVDMQDAAVIGTLPTEFSGLKQLQGLDFKSTLIGGSIPESWTGLRDLRYLRLTDSEARGEIPMGFSALSELRELQMHSRFLTAKIHPKLSVLTKLAYLSAPPDTAGELPPEWSVMKSMSYFQLVGSWATNVTGPLPREWSTWPLAGMTIANTDITGSLPAEWSTFTRVRIIDLVRNQLTGTLPTEWSTLTNVRDLLLFENCIEGTVPKEWSTMVELRRLGLSDNRLHCPEGKNTFISSVPPNIATALMEANFRDPCPRPDPKVEGDTLEILEAVLISMAVFLAGALIFLAVGVVVHRKRCKNPSCVHRHPGRCHSLYGHFGLLMESKQRCKWCSLWCGEIDAEVSLNEIRLFMVPENYVASGGFCRIYRGTWRGRDVALKELLCGHDSEAQEMFKAECATLSTVSGSDTFIQLLGVCQEGSTPVLILEFMAGGTLRERIYHDPPLSTIRILEIAKQIARGLAYLHRRSLVHRDIKPENILLNFRDTGSGSSGTVQAKIADLGLAHKAGSLLDSSVFTQSAGTAGYMAPEQYDGSFTSKVDVYALGVIINECFAREQPYPQYEHYVQVCHAVVMKGERPRLAEEQMPSAVQKLVRMCWDDAMKRPSAKEVEIMLESLIDGEIRANDPSVKDTSSIPTLDQLASRLAVLSAPSFHVGHDLAVHGLPESPPMQYG